MPHCLLSLSLAALLCTLCFLSPSHAGGVCLLASFLGGADDSGIFVEICYTITFLNA